MTTKLFNIDEFHSMVREMVRESIKEEMLLEMEMEASVPPPTPQAAMVQVPPAAKSPSVPPPVPTAAKPLQKVGDNVKIPGTNMNLNQLLAAAQAEQDMGKKKQLLARVADVMTTLNTLEESSRKKVNTKKPMNARLIARINKMVEYEESDEDILKTLKTEIDEDSVTTRWVKFMIKMARKGLMEESINQLKDFQFKKKDPSDAEKQEEEDLKKESKCLQEALQSILNEKTK